MTTIPMPLYDGGADLGTRANRRDYLEPMAERWPGGSLLQLVDWLEVDHSERWQKRPRPGKPDATYCDHYAADFVQQATGQQLISAWVWWTPDAILRMRRGETVPVVYGETVIEHGAKGLHAWMREWGSEFGWSFAGNDTDLRSVLTREQTIGLILTPSHVAVALPDDVANVPGMPPLQTQAGSRNVRLWRQDDWYRRRSDVVRVWLDPSLMTKVTR